MDGTTLSHYRILATLGEGGMGVVYLAEDQVLHRRVALKVLRPETVGDEGRRARFLQEARSAAALNHPHIATIYEANETDATLFIAMELVDGRDLRAVLREPLPLPLALDLATQIAEGLAHAHAHSVVHRDLKPENVMVTPKGRVKILDFGLAKVMASGQDTTMTMLGGQSATATAGQLTMQGQLMGTPGYMSPEQARGQAVDFRSDIFSFGSTLYEMCTGKPSFSGPTPIDTLSAVLHQEPPPVSQLAAAVPPAIEDIVTRCLAKDPARRYASTDDLVAELRGVDLNAKPRRRRRRAFPRRKLTLGVGAGVAIAAALAAGLWLRPQWGGVAQRGSGRHTTDWILVADFEGTSEKPGLVDACRELVTAALAQSSIVTPLSRAQVQRGIHMAGLPDTTRVVGERARELAYRATARTYVGGRVDQILSSYSIVLNLVDAKTRKPLYALNAVAENESDLIGTMEKLSHQLRERLGEKRSVVRNTGRMNEIMTPSFGAFQMYVQALALHQKRQWKASNRALDQALALDPQFASAEKLRALNFTNLGVADSARTAFESALSRPERLTESEQMDLRFFDARVVRYDLQEALGISDRLVQLPQVSTSFLNNRSTVQFNLGRYEEALVSQDSAIAIAVFGVSDILRLNAFKILMQLGRYDEAGVMRDSLSEANRPIASLEYSVCRGDWPAAESLAVRLQKDGASDEVRFQAAIAAAALAADRGAIETAAHELEPMILRAPNRFWADVARMGRVQLGICMGAPVPVNSPFLADTTMACTIVRGIAAAAAGDSAALRVAVRQADARGGPEKRRYGGDLQLLQALSMAAAGTLEPSLPQLEEAMTAGPGPWFCGRVPLRWLVATAHDRAGRTDAAIRAYELVLSSERLHQDAWVWWPLAQPFAHLRLAALLAKTGRHAEAEAHARAVLDRLKAPDSQGALLVAEARSLLAASPSQ